MPSRENSIRLLAHLYPLLLPCVGSRNGIFVAQIGRRVGRESAAVESCRGDAGEEAQRERGFTYGCSSTKLEAL